LIILFASRPGFCRPSRAWEQLPCLATCAILGYDYLMETRHRAAPLEELACKENDRDRTVAQSGHATT